MSQNCAKCVEQHYCHHQNYQVPRPNESQLLVPPLNFSMVAPGVYRSGFPNRKSHEFLLYLGLKTIIYVHNDDCKEYHLKFIEDNNINFMHYKMDANKEPFEEMNNDDVKKILGQVLDKTNHPVLIHCNRGIRRVGCIVGCIRKIQRWAMTAIFTEYQRFSGTKIRIADQEFIEVADVNVDLDDNLKPSWV